MLPFEREQLQDFEQRTGMRWREVRPESLRHYGHLADRYAVFLCTTENCRSGIYLVPAGTQPQKPKFYAQLLNFCQDAGLKLLPSFKCDLDEFPAVPLHSIEFGYGTWNLQLKFDGDLILHRAGGGQLITYTVGELASFNSSVKVAAEDYILTWKRRTIKVGSNSTDLELELGNSITYENINIGLIVTSNTITGSSSIYQVKTQVNGWIVEGQITFKITGERIEHSRHMVPVTTLMAGGAVSGYLLYRTVRMVPSLLPPLWWTIPENAMIP